MNLLLQNIKNLRLADLQLFLSAAKMGNLGQAASLHRLSQSAASTAVKRVEIALGVNLSLHKKRQFEITRQAQGLLPKLELWLEQLMDIVNEEGSTPIRFVSSHGMAQIAIPALLSLDKVEFKTMRPDKAYRAILNNEADLALVLDNAPWKALAGEKVGQGSFQLYGAKAFKSITPVLLPEDQTEVFTLQKNWTKHHNTPLPIKTRIPSWSLIASICETSSEVGFLPDFLAKKKGLKAVSWQPNPTEYALLALYREKEKSVLYPRLKVLIERLKKAFTS